MLIKSVNINLPELFYGVALCLNKCIIIIMTNNVQHIVFDGSHRPGRFGVGLVFLSEGLDVLSVESILVEYKISQTERMVSMQAEFIAAAFAISKADSNLKLILYGDNLQSIDYINGMWRPKKRQNFEIILPQLDSLLKERESTVTAVHRDDKNCPIPRYCFAIAHNASAIASGSVKRECTLPYDGKFSSDVDITNLWGHHLSDEKERLHRYGFW